MNDISMFRLHLLRALYLLIVVGLAAVVWPSILVHNTPWGMAQGTVICMLAAFSLLCALGLRYPLQMLPILLWEIIWKTLWLLLVAVPAWRAGQVGPELAEQIFSVGFVILVYIAVPWGYVYRQYVQQAGAPWRKSGPNPSVSPAQSPAKA